MTSFAGYARRDRNRAAAEYRRARRNDRLAAELVAAAATRDHTGDALFTLGQYADAVAAWSAADDLRALADNCVASADRARASARQWAAQARSAQAFSDRLIRERTATGEEGR